MQTISLMLQHHIPNKKFVAVLQYLFLNDFGCETLRLLEAEVCLRDLYVLFEEPDLKVDTYGPLCEGLGLHGQQREST